MNILLIGEIYSKNIGDQAIHYGIKNYLHSKDISVSSLDLSCRSRLSQHNTREIRQSKSIIRNSRLLYISLNIIRRLFKHIVNLKCWIKMFKKNDIIIVGGGSLLINNSYSFPISLMFIKLCARLTNKPYYVLGCSVSDNITLLSKYMLYSFLVSAKQIYLRDVLSTHYIKRVFKLRSVLSSDLALLINKKPNKKFSNNNNIIAINIIGFTTHNILNKKDFQDKYNKMILNAIDFFIQKNYCVELFTTGEEIDYVNAQNILLKTKHNISIFRPSSVEELLNYLDNCSGIVSTRLHSAILSFLSEVPFVSISWDNKINGFLESISMLKNCFSVNDSVSDIGECLIESMEDNPLVNDIEKDKQIKLLKLHIEEILNEKNCIIS